MYLRSRSVEEFQPLGDIDIIDANDIGEPATQVEQDPFDSPTGSIAGGGFVPETPFSSEAEMVEIPVSVEAEMAEEEIESTPVAMARRGRIRVRVRSPSTPDITVKPRRRSKRSKSTPATPRINWRVSRATMDHIRRIEGLPEGMRDRAESQYLDFFTS